MARLFISVAITCAVTGPIVAFSAITAIAAIATNPSYLFPSSCDTPQAVRPLYPPSGISAGSCSVASVYISFLFAVLLLPRLYPVTAQTLNYAPICIGAITIVSVVGWAFPKWGARH
jgi:hypothetical protein